jgi:hypothetical protein
MVDFIEFNMRKVAVDNTRFCARQCKLFKLEDIKDLTQQEELTQERNELSCFEKCLGKHSDSFEFALDVWKEHLHKTRKNPVTSHSHEVEDKDRQYLLQGGEDEPIYDTPFTRKL